MDDPNLTPSHFEAARARQAADAAKARGSAASLWRRLQPLTDGQALRTLVLDDPKFHSWAFCEKLCHESADLADDEPGRAGELAELAFDLLPKVSGGDDLLCGLQECVWQHVGNVRRARGDLKGAEQAFRRAAEFLVGGMMASLPSLMQRDRMAALEAALHRDQGDRFEALRKIDHAITLAGGQGPNRPALLLEKARLHRLLGQPEKALTALSWADRQRESFDVRLLLRIEIERGGALCDLGRHGEVKQLPSRVRKTAESYARERTRLLCVEGRVSAALGRLEEAEAILWRALAGHHEHAVADLALLCLEIAALHARDGRSDALARLAELALRLAEASALSRESAATLKLCGRLATQGKLSYEQAMLFAGDFSRAAARG